MTSRNMKPYSARPDHSVLRPCIEVANSGMKQAIYAMKCGSKEVVDVLLNECNVIYECKVCFNMFRSLANLISHKRTFCKNKSNNVLHVFNNGDDNSQSEDVVTPEKMVVVQPEPVETVFPDKDLEVKDYTPSIELLKEAGILAEIEERPLVDSLLPQKHSQSKLKEIVKKLRTIQETRAPENTQQNLFLEPLRQTDHAVFQTCFFNVNDKTTMSQRYVDLIKARQLTAAFVGPDNKVIEPTDSSRSYSPASSEYSFHTYQGDKIPQFDTYKPPKPSSYDYPCLKCNYENARLYRVIHHMKQKHDLKEHHNITKVRSKIREKAIRKSKNYSNIIIEDDMNPWVLVKKITDEEIDQHLQAAEEARKKSIEKMALGSILLGSSGDGDKKMEQVSLPKLPPSIGETEVNIDDDDDYKEVIFNQNSNNKDPDLEDQEDKKSGDGIQDESSNGVVNNEEQPIKIKISLTNFKKRSRSSSPASSNGSSDQSSSTSKTENLELTKRSRQSSSTSVTPPILSNSNRRDILSTRFETNEKSNSSTNNELKEPNGNTTEDETMKTVDPVNDLQKKLGQHPIDEEQALHSNSNSGRRSRRRIGPASKHK